MRRSAAGLALVALLLPAPGRGDATEAGEIRSLLEKATTAHKLCVDSERVHALPEVSRWYAAHDCRPLWTGPEAAPGILQETVGLLAGAGRHGLRPGDYHLDYLRSWQERLAEAPDPDGIATADERAELDLVLSDALLTFGSHLASGKVDPEQLYPHWVSEKRQAEVLEALNRFAADGDGAALLRALLPRQPGYWELSRAAAALEEVVAAGDWGRLQVQGVLRPDDASAEVVDLRLRLQRSGDLAADASDAGEQFDPPLAAAVRRFQARHGLAADGVVGRATRRALNVSAAARLEQVRLNLERWRWLPAEWGEEYLVVNTAAFSLAGVRDGGEVLRMRVIVGKAAQRTPVFSKDLRYIEINPYWNVPPEIARQEVLPHLRRNPRYLEENHYEWVAGWAEPVRRLDPSEVDWSGLAASDFVGRFRQVPGPWNALGRIKFMFPNPFNVYLHDTSEPGLFERANRALSHGCIRVADPVGLALFVLHGDPRWTRERLEAAMASGKRQVIAVARPLRIHLLYWTAWVEEGGALQFREDVYGRDATLRDALERVPDERLRLSGTAGVGAAAE